MVPPSLLFSLLFSPLFLLGVCLAAARAAAGLGQSALSLRFCGAALALLLWLLLGLLWELLRGPLWRLGCVGWNWLRLWHQAHRFPLFVRGRARLPVLRSLGGMKSLTSSPATIVWGGRALPSASATTHFLVAGTTGAGKTLLLQQLMHSVLPTIGRPDAGGQPLDRRALVYDAKGDVLSFLHRVASCRIVTLHPFEARGAVWDLAQDITTPAAALQAAALLIPLERGGGSNPFFTLAAQNLLRGVLLSFLETVGENWTLRDVVLTLRYEERLRQVLEKTLEGRAILDQFFGVKETLQGVRATIATKIAPLEVVAALWDTAPEKVSLREFMAGEFILVLGNDESARTALDAINRVLFQRLSELILAGSESRTRQTWLFLDEVREAGRLDGLSRLMTKGRSKGACVALGFQAIEGMREVYGNNVAEEITGLCSHKAILRLESPLSARWASSLFDKTEEIERRQSRSHNLQERGGGIWPSFGRSRSWSEQRLTRDAVLASEIMTLPPPGPEHGLCGYFLSREQGAWQARLAWDALQVPPRGMAAGAAGGGGVAGRSERCAPQTEATGEEARADDACADFVPRPESSQYLREWTPADLERLGLKRVRLLTPQGASAAGAESDGEGECGPVPHDPVRRSKKLRPPRSS